MTTLSNELKVIVDNLNTMSTRKLNNYIRNLEYINEGSSRTVYKINSKYVIKQAFNKAGIMQNKVEVDAYNNLKHKALLNPVYAHDKKYRWVVADRCNEIDDISFYEFKKKFGLTYDDFENIIDIAGCTEMCDEDGWTNHFINGTRENSLKCKFVKQLEKFLKQKTGIFDFHSRNFGYNIRKKQIVLLDYGFNEEVYERFYVY